jgi:diaminohydroxyphosphoribosylaminopyrimidine deaminase/5-amino-6-(5-phosphoribosylamino)uracil reductase
MTEFSKADCELMARALVLARRGIYSAHPNPRVGCVLVRGGEIVGEGWHRKTGEAHAEVLALQDAGDAANDATAYVTLEPCAHHGKTAPCSKALIDAGISDAVVAMQDPFREVNGDGIGLLEEAGIPVRVGLMSNEAARLNEGFISRVTRHRPFVRLKVAASIDGCTAMADGESQWITGPEARTDVQRLRASSGAVLTGIGTVVADDPSLTVRDDSIKDDGIQPMRVILDNHLRMPVSAQMLQLPGKTAVFCTADGNRDLLEKAGALVYLVSGQDGRVDLREVLAALAEEGVNDVLVEAGHTLAGSFLSAGLVDELVIYQSPHIMGSETQGMFSTPGWRQMSQRMQLVITDVRRVGADTRITARPKPAGEKEKV